MPLPEHERQVARLNAQDMAYTRIRDWIVNGPLEAGEVLRDTDIAALLGVSRTPVREALIRLSQEGLVSIAAGRRTVVAELDFSRAADLFAIGGLLDSFAAHTAAATIGRDDVERMQQILQQMSGTDDQETLTDLDEQFHHVYYRSSGNEVLMEFLDRIEMETRRVERVAFGNPRIRGEALDEHTEILRALMGREAERARRAAIANWHNSWQRIHDAIEPRLGRSSTRRFAPGERSAGGRASQTDRG